jgi:hypothetical protein
MVRCRSMRRWRSGQSQQTVNLSPYGLRRFESFPTHKTTGECQFCFVRKGFERRSDVSPVGETARRCPDLGERRRAESRGRILPYAQLWERI